MSYAATPSSPPLATPTTTATPITTAASPLTMTAETAARGAASGMAAPSSPARRLSPLPAAAIANAAAADTAAAGGPADATAAAAAGPAGAAASPGGSAGATAGTAAGGASSSHPPQSPPPPLPLPSPLPPPPTRGTRYPYPLPTLESALRIPPLEHQVGAHVAHLVAHRDGPAAEVLAELLGVPQDLMSRLIWFGAVYYCPVPPLPPTSTPTSTSTSRDNNKTKRQKGASAAAAAPIAHPVASPSASAATGPSVSAAAGPSATSAAAGPSSSSPSLPMMRLGPEQQQLADIQAVRQAALAKWGRHSKHQTPRRLTSPDQPLSEGGYLRAHTHPKRFPLAHALSAEQWGRRLLAVADDYVVVNKPAGLQVPPTVDNVQESLLACVEKALSLPPNSLHPAHRLDAGTEGVVVLARDAAFASYFRELMAHKEQHSVRKQYRCLVPLGPPGAFLPPPPLGSLVHWVLEDQREAGEAAHTVVVSGPDTPGAARCELRVEQVERVRLGARAVEMWGVEEAHEVTITLITGRTHQIRVQMGALGLPLLGDRLYSALVSDGALWATTEEAPPPPPSNNSVVDDGCTSTAAAATAVAAAGTAAPAAVAGAAPVAPPPPPSSSSSSAAAAAGGFGSCRLDKQPAGDGADIRDGGGGGGSGGDGDDSDGGDGDGDGEGGDCRRLMGRRRQRQVQEVRGRALEWCLPALQNPLAPLALQAHSLTVLEDGPMGRAPACFCAGEPWWRAA